MVSSRKGDGGVLLTARARNQNEAAEVQGGRLREGAGALISRDPCAVRLGQEGTGAAPRTSTRTLTPAGVPNLGPATPWGPGRVAMNLDEKRKMTSLFLQTSVNCRLLLHFEFEAVRHSGSCSSWDLVTRTNQHVPATFQVRRTFRSFMCVLLNQHGSS